MSNNITVNNGYPDTKTEFSIVGHGESIEHCFSDAASAMFSLLADTAGVRPIQIITFDFIEEDLDAALSDWLSFVLAKSQERNLAFNDFRLKREGNVWKATISGEPWRDEIKRNLNASDVKLTHFSVKKVEHLWEARCVLLVS